MKNYRIEIKWAFIFIVMMLLWMLMEKLTGLHDNNIEMHPVITNLVAIPAILVYVLALLEKRSKFYNGSMSYKQAFVSGLIMTAIITLFSPLSQYITTAVISPDFFDNMINYAVDHGKASREQAESYFNQRSYMIQTLLFTPVMGLVTTAIVSIFVKKK